MFPALLSHNPDLKQLRDEGYVVELRDSHLLVHDVAYLNSQLQVQRGTLVSPITIVSGRVGPPPSHVIHFVGEIPYSASGKPIAGIGTAPGDRQLSSSIAVNMRFSNRPPDGYPDNHAKFSRYIKILGNEARAIDETVTAQTYRIVKSDSEEGVFRYPDTNSSRNGTLALHSVYAGLKVAIIGLGGTGGYLLDAIAKVPIAEIHLYDDDTFNPHNAYRAPGAASLEEVNEGMSKVDYFAKKYGAMHGGIQPHYMKMLPADFHQLDEMDFVFVAIDSGGHKKRLFAYLAAKSIPLIDVGIGVTMNEVTGKLRASLRTTFASADQHDHLDEVVSYIPAEEDLYAKNIQIGELNAINAYLAVVRWKQSIGFYDVDDAYGNLNLATADLSITHAFQTPVG